MAKVSNKGGPQFMSRALRPGGGENAAPKKKPDFGSIKGAKVGKGIPNMPAMKPPNFGGRTRKR